MASIKLFLLLLFSFTSWADLTVDSFSFTPQFVGQSATYTFQFHLTNLAWVEEKMYFSEFNVVPLLIPVNLVLKVVPSVDVAIEKVYRLSFPFHHAISTLQIFLVVPKSARIHEPNPGFDHLVLRLLSMAFEGGYPA